METQTGLEQFSEPRDKFKIKEQILKWLPAILGGALLICLIYIGNGAFKNWKNSIYQQGVTMGAIKMQQDLITGWWQVGAIQLNVPIDSNGKLNFNVDTTYPVILIQQPQATTTQ